jgi:hypothetical protein
LTKKPVHHSIAELILVDDEISNPPTEDIKQPPEAIKQPPKAVKKRRQQKKTATKAPAIPQDHGAVNRKKKPGKTAPVRKKNSEIIFVDEDD